MEASEAAHSGIGWGDQAKGLFGGLDISIVSFGARLLSGGCLMSKMKFALPITLIASILATSVVAGSGFRARGPGRSGGFWFASSPDGKKIAGMAGCDQSYNNCTTPLRGTVVDAKGPAIMVDWDGFGRVSFPRGYLY
jgi:hypothetical protein